MFVQGILHVQEEPYRNELDLRLPGGETLFLFYQRPRELRDTEEDALDALFESGKFYELLVTVRARQMTYSPTILPGTRFELVVREEQGPMGVVTHHEVLRGTVLDPTWDAARQPYQAIATPRLYEQRYVLLETAVGNVVISHGTLQRALPLSPEDLTIGGYLEWPPSRFDVLAIIEKREV